jgi:vacuolar iron transporter family protein
MKESIKVGLSFGLTSGIITTLGLMVGLSSGTGLKMAVIGGIITIAIADAFSDALGIHLSEEAQKKNTQRAVWKSTTTTFLTKLVVALTFIIPVIILDLDIAIIVSVIYGLILLSIFSFFLAKWRGERPLGAVIEHLVIAGIVILITNYVGRGIAVWFG